MPNIGPLVGNSGFRYSNHFGYRVGMYMCYECILHALKNIFYFLYLDASSTRDKKGLNHNSTRNLAFKFESCIFSSSYKSIIRRRMVAQKVPILINCLFLLLLMLMSTGHRNMNLGICKIH
jgi:hypothetical protein